MGCITSLPVSDSEVTKENSNQLEFRRLQRTFKQNLVGEEYDANIEKYYTIDRGLVLGTGASGAVLLCTHKNTGTEYALKRIRISGMNHSRLEAIKQETHILVCVFS